MPDLIGVCGAGTMGSGIAETAALHGIPVVLYDLDPVMLSRASGLIQADLRQLIEKNRIGKPEADAVLARIAFTDDINRCRAGIILEAVVEQMDVKLALFRALAAINSAGTLLASNSSSLSIQSLAEQTGFPERVVGMHFFNPAPKMKLVEIIRTRYLSESVIQSIRDLAISMGKTPIVCADAPGFIVNHVARPFYLEALRLAEGAVADMSTIDRLTEAAGFKMGPFHLMDLIGNDINFTVSHTLYQALGNPERLRPSKLQQQLVEKGALGRKSGKGFFEYTK